MYFKIFLCFFHIFCFQNRNKLLVQHITLLKFLKHEQFVTM